MTTFLTLCARLATRSGVIGAAPAAVTAQTGRQAKCVDWIVQAWEDVQGLYQDWSFLQGEWSSTLTAGNSNYAAASLGIVDRFGEWKGDRETYRPVTLYKVSTGVADEGTLREIPYDNWRTMYDRGSQTPNRPTYYAIAPDQTLRFGPVPDLDYAVRGEYRKAPQTLAANLDEPDMPARFHDIIVDRAMMLIGEHDEAPAGLSGAIRAYSEKLTMMQRDLLPDITSILGK